MTNNELLFAISDMLDMKLNAAIQPLKNELHDEMQTLRNELQAEIQAVRNELLTEIQALRNELHAEIQAINNQLHLLQLNQETIVMPRLNTIEACYTDTFKRYKNHADIMEATYEDVNLLKKVVAEHSQKLQMLA